MSRDLKMKRQQSEEHFCFARSETNSFGKKIFVLFVPTEIKCDGIFFFLSFVCFPATFLMLSFSQLPLTRDVCFLKKDKVNSNDMKHSCLPSPQTCHVQKANLFSSQMSFTSLISLLLSLGVFQQENVLI